MFWGTLPPFVAPPAQGRPRRRRQGRVRRGAARTRTSSSQRPAFVLYARKLDRPRGPGRPTPSDAFTALVVMVPTMRGTSGSGRRRASCSATERELRVVQRRLAPLRHRRHPLQPTRPTRASAPRSRRPTRRRRADDTRPPALTGSSTRLRRRRRRASGSRRSRPTCSGARRRSAPTRSRGRSRRSPESSESSSRPDPVGARAASGGHDATRRHGEGRRLLLSRVALVAAAGAGRASAADAVAPWQAFDALDGALFDAELAATTTAPMPGGRRRRRRGRAGPRGRLRPLGRGERGSPAGGRSCRLGPQRRRPRRRRPPPRGRRRSRGATRRSSPRRARATSTRRVAGCSSASSSPPPGSRTRAPPRASRSPRSRDGVVPRARAVRSIRSDLLDTYEALLRYVALRLRSDALRAGFREGGRRGGDRRGYWGSSAPPSRAARSRGGRATRRAPSTPRRRRAERRAGRDRRRGGEGRRRRSRLPRRAAQRVGAGAPRGSARAATSGSSRSSTRAASRTGASSCDFEIQEAIAFRDGAAVAFGDLQSYLAGRDLAATRSVQRALGDLTTRSATPSAGRRSPTPRGQGAHADGDGGARRRLSRTTGRRHGRGRLRRHRRDARSQVTAPRPPATPARRAGRLEAYATFELGPEQRLRGLAPSLFQRIEGLFWYGADGARRPGAAPQAERERRASSRRPMARSTCAQGIRRGIGSGPQSRTLGRRQQRDHRLPRGSRGGAHPRRADGEHGRRAAPATGGRCSPGSASRSWPASSPGSSRRPCSARSPAGGSGSRRSSRSSRSASCS